MRECYALSPLQEGMLYHRTLARDSGVEIFHMIGTLPEPLVPEVFRQAWQRIVDRYDIFRTSFHWTDLEEPQQCVHPTAELAWHQEDLSGKPRTEQDRRVAEYLALDRSRGVDLSNPPLIRFAVFRFSDAEWKFIWTMYHGVVDGRSVRAILIEVFDHYEAILRSDTVDDTEAVPFRKYIDWLEQQDLEAARKYWQDLLSGFRAPTPLSTAKTKVRLEANQVAHSDHDLVLSPAKTAALEHHCKVLGITLHTVLQGAWAFLLGRYSNTRDTVFGCVKSNRAAVPEGRKIMGPLINTLIMRVQSADSRGFGEYLQAIRQQWLAHRPHEFVPLAKVQRWSDLSLESRIFESLVVFENFRWNDSFRSLGGKWSRRHLEIHRQPEYPLTLYGFKSTRQVLKLIYDRRAFDDTMILRMSRHLGTILDALIEDPGQSLGQVDFLSQAERSQILDQWNDTSVPGDPTAVHRLFTQWVERTPDALALADGETRLTYRQLQQRSSAIAEELRQYGVGPGVPVALCLRRSAALVTAALAVLEAGGAYVPLDPDHPASRLGMMLGELGQKLLLTHPDLVESLSSIDARILPVSAAPQETDGDDPPPRDVVDPQRLAYLIYTSGSTGRPKGVSLSHDGLSNLAEIWRDHLTIRPGDRGVLLFNPAFDGSVVEIWPYLTAGASIHIPPEEIRLSPNELCHWMLRRGIHSSTVPTPVAELLLEQSWPPEASLRRLVAGGDRLTRRPDPQTPFRLFNGYGPAENTVAASLSWVEPQTVEGRPPTIGRPLANVAVYVLDPRMEPVPVGVSAEIFLGGRGLAQGYWRRPSITAERFLPNPFANRPGSRLYRTGDLGRYTETGELEFCGRTDHQVKVRGMRVELGEIEFHFGRHPAVKEVVVGLFGKSQHPFLAAHFVPHDGDQTPEAQEIRTFLRRHLPAHMIPAVFVPLASFPLTTRGKLDRRALPRPEDPAASAEHQTWQPPRTAKEKTLAQAWQEVLRLERVGIDDDFYEMGGHSLILIKLHEKLRETFGPGIRMADLLDHLTIREQATLLSQREEDALPPLSLSAPPAPTSSLGKLEEST